MSNRHSTVRRLAFVLSALGLSFAVAGCESMDKFNPFTEKEKILQGQRQSVFPEGVPGVDYSAPPPQPASQGGYEPAAAPEPAPAPATGTKPTR